MTATDEQRHPTRTATISALFVVSAFVAGKAGRDAILLSRFSVTSLPLFIGLSAALSLPIILLTGRLMVRFGPARLIPVMNAASGLFAIGEWLLLGSYPRPIAVLVFFHLSTASAVLVSGFWSIINERFDIRSAKRHIGSIGLGATLGGILGGVIAERSAVYFERDAILLVLAALQLTCAAALFAMGRGAAPVHVPVPVPSTGEAKEPKDGMWSALGVVARSRLLRGIGAIVVLTAIAAGILDYVFKADLVHAGSRDGLLRSLALFYTVTNVVTAVIQVAVCGPIINKLGVARSVATLPLTVTAFGVFTLLVRAPIASAFARAAELVTRNSVYRAGYELLYAPLPEHQKRPTKVMLDVGADKIGDILGAQIVVAILWFAIDARTGLLIAALVVGVLAVGFALRLPRAYTKALEDSLMTHAAASAATADEAAQPEPWISLNSLPSFGEPGELVPLRLRSRVRRQTPAPSPAPAPASAQPHVEGDHGGALVERVRALVSPDAARIRIALATPLQLELVAHVLELIGRDDVAPEACAALAAIAPRCTGQLVDALLDPTRDMAVRRRLPALLAHAEPLRAKWGLWQGLADPSFEIRYRCGAALAHLVANGHIKDILPDEVFATVRRELGGDLTDWKSRQIVNDLIATADGEAGDGAATGLEHVFHVLGLALPAEPLRIALQALKAEDAPLRGMALEYLESILPPDVRAQLWPLLDQAEEGEAAASSAQLPVAKDEAAPASPAPPPPPPPQPPPRKPRSQDELLAELKTSYSTVVERRKARPPA